MRLCNDKHNSNCLVWIHMASGVVGEGATSRRPYGLCFNQKNQNNSIYAAGDSRVRF
jgi:hypothetical protein